MLLEKRIPISYVLNKIKYNLIYVMLVSVTVLLITDYCGRQFPEMPLTIPAFIGTAISILLSFKLNQSYDRWWEARKVWGSIVNDSRTFIIQLTSLTENTDSYLIKKIAYRHIAWCYALGKSLRGLDPLEGLDSFLTKEDLHAVRQHQNKPLAMLHMHAKDIKQLRESGKLDSFRQIQLDNTLVRFSESQGKAERIKSTVFPVTYRKFLHFIIYLFVVTLAIALNVTGAFEIPLLILISSAFFLLEKSATHMQDPFENRPTDTAVTTIARTIEINIRQMLNEQAQVPKLPETFYAL
jgi:ion channel-forming bestrophin family protein